MKSYNFIFDVDNTLCKSSRRIDDRMWDILNKLILTDKCSVSIVTGATYEKLSGQIPSSILDNCMYIYTCSGAIAVKLRRWGGYVSLPSLSDIHHDIVKEKEELERIYNEHPYEKKAKDFKSCFIEKTHGVYYFSLIGTNATYGERQDYIEYDKENNDREQIATKLAMKFGNHYDFLLGGEVSIDILARGIGKHLILNSFRNHDPKTLIFFGDKIYPGGNDYTIAQEILKSGGIVHAVADPTETYKLLQEYYGEVNESI